MECQFFNAYAYVGMLKLEKIVDAIMSRSHRKDIFRREEVGYCHVYCFDTKIRKIGPVIKPVKGLTVFSIYGGFSPSFFILLSFQSQEPLT